MHPWVPSPGRRQSIGPSTSRRKTKGTAGTPAHFDVDRRLPVPLHCGICSEDDVLVVLVAQKVLALGCIFLCLLTILVVLLRQPGSLLHGGVSLFLARHFLQAVKLFSVQLVELGVDVLDGVFCAWNDDMLAVAVSIGVDLAAKDTHMAFTRRLTTLITSSNITKAVCRLASSTNVSTARAYVSLHLCTCWPPLPRPVNAKSLLSAV
jgi:hypothetical protein